MLQDFNNIQKTHQSLHHRKSTHLIIQIDENFVFQINKAVSKFKMLRFLKIYDEITKCVD